MNSIQSERRQQGLDDNWTLFLGQVMACCNSHSTRLKYSVSAYEAVFGQKLHTPVSCSIDQLRKCTSIADRLRICPDERLQAYVKESDIVSCVDEDNDNEEEDEEDSLEDDANAGKGNEGEEDANDDDDYADANAGRGNDDEDDDNADYAAAHTGRLKSADDDDDFYANYASAHVDFGEDNDRFLDAQSTQDDEEDFQHSLAEDININRKRALNDQALLAEWNSQQLGEEFDVFQQRIGDPPEHICAAFERVCNADAAADNFVKIADNANATAAAAADATRCRVSSRDDHVEDQQEVTELRAKRQRRLENVPISERKKPPEEIAATLEPPHQDSHSNNSATEVSPVILCQEVSPLNLTSLVPSSDFGHQTHQAPTNAVDLPVQGHQEAPTSPGNAENLSVDRYLTFTIEEAWLRGDIARYHRNLTSRRRREFCFLFANLGCQDCCFPDLNRLIPIGDQDYVDQNVNTNRWYDGDFISAFSSLTAHYAHKTFPRNIENVGVVGHPMLIHVTYPKQQLEEDQCKMLPSHVKRVVAVMHHRDHYAVMEIDIKDNTVTIYDGLGHPLLNWFDHIINGMKRCGLIPLPVTHRVTGHDFASEPARTRQTPSAQGFEVQLNNEIWRLR
jgi:hypothetical protein